MKVQFGCGPNLLPGWANHDIETDIRKPLPYAIGSVDYVLASHVIEHIEFREGLSFLGECLRILKPQGVLRLAFPDITREDLDIESYRSGLYREHYNRQLHCKEDVWHSILIDWGHRSCWSKTMAERVLLAVGFDSVSPGIHGYSSHLELREVDGIVRQEETILEAIR